MADKYDAIIIGSGQGAVIRGPRMECVYAISASGYRKCPFSANVIGAGGKQ